LLGWPPRRSQNDRSKKLITAFEVGSIFRIVDQASPALRAILKQVREAQSCVRQGHTMTTGVYSVLGFVAKLGAIERDMHELGPAIVARACEMVAAEAKRVIGEGYDFWPALAPATLAHKMLNTPLLETGELRGSIEWNASGNEGHVGSNLDKAVWHELGTARIPPRSFLAGAAMAMEDKIHKMAERAVVAVMLGKGLASAEMRELPHLLHTLHHVGHAVGEAADTVLDGPDDNNGRSRR
jgi:hypothetical protein